MSKISPQILERLDELYQIRQMIPRDLYEREIDLVDVKWPAYRFMGPLEATRIFRNEYEMAYKEQHKINVDINEAQKMKIGRKISFLENNAKLTQLWKARQYADSLGVPYPEYLEFCMDFASRRNLRKYLPQPNQLAPSQKNRYAWEVNFEKYWTDDRKYVALSRMQPMAQYTVSNRRELAAQIEFASCLKTSGLQEGISVSAFTEA